MVSVAVAGGRGCVGASAFINGARSVTDSAVVKLTNAEIHVVADTIAVGIGRAITAAVAEDIELVSVAVAVSGWDAGTSAVIDGARSVADSAVIELANAIVYVIADAILVEVC